MTYNPNQADYDGDREGDLCDLTPYPGELVAGSNTLGGGGIGGFSFGGIVPTALVGSRCKLQTFTQKFDQAGLLNVIKYEGMFRVCYVPGGGGILSFSDVRGDATYTLVPWEWKGNDPGYPHGVKLTAHSVLFHYRGGAQVCIWKGCGPLRHPWVKIVFKDDNTMSVSAGVA